MMSNRFARVTPATEASGDGEHDEESDCKLEHMESDCVLTLRRRPIGLGNAVMDAHLEQRIQIATGNAQKHQGK